MNGLLMFRRELATRWLGATITVVSVFAMLLLTMAVMQTIDMSFMDQYPETMLKLMGIPKDAGPETLAYGSTLNLMGGLALGGVAVAIGSDILAGEERRRTLSTLLSHPISRTATVVAKAAALLTIVALAACALWAGVVLANLILGVDGGEAHLWELAIAIGANALFHGALALAIGSTTGDKGLAAGIAGVVLAAGWLMASVLPGVADYADMAKYIPYGWLTEPNVLMDGMDAAYLALQLGAAAALMLVAVLWLPRRDLRTIPPRSLRERVTALPGMNKLANEGTRRPATLFGLTFGRGARLLAAVCTIMVLFTLMMGPVWDEMGGQAAEMVEAIPQDLMAIFGAGDMGTPTGFLWGEMFGLMAPAAVIIVAVAAAAGLAAEERSGQLGVLLSGPMTRMRPLAATVATALGYIAIFAVVQGLATWATTAISTLEIEPTHIVGTMFHVFALGVCIGGIALLVAAVTGSGKAAVWTAVGLGLIGHFGYAALSLSDDTKSWSRISPFHYYASAEPLANGANWGHVATLSAVGFLAMAVAFPLFQRRDLRV